MENLRNIPKAFFGFLVASLLIWLLINMSKEYSSSVSYSVDYQELPQNKLLEEKPQENISLAIKATGFKLFSANISSKKILLNTDKLRQKNATDFYLLPESQKLAIQKQLASGLTLEGILQDTLFLKIGSLATKKVPVVANLDLQFQPGYNLSEKVTIKPDSITISGPEFQLKSIQNIAISSFKMEGLNRDFSKNVSLKLPESIVNTKFSATEVSVSGKVDKFTEGNFEVPFKVENVPFGITLNTFPKTVKVTYIVGLKNFGNVTADSFEVVCDYKQAVENELSYLIPKVHIKSSEVSSVKVTPDKIEYLIHK
ncbi:hypothetical protein LPB136_02470 [Tenacibaculum todarodis]|uniref:YbbR-like domain-containing protein n=1 Tax=Tenacibaculum todarodis TaxID=1850252 RepID=A0A1L3JGQ8_9FLAO|nr:YbbR-like domain-containing protein [Tenacibaculum todarodis]APG64302.1 hypothetical protein LPB136_02470 [Tenacibaculum todarodis]